MYSIAQIKNIIDSEGLDYAIQDYVDYQNIEDAKLAELWQHAQIALDNIELYLRSQN